MQLPILIGPLSSFKNSAKRFKSSRRIPEVQDNKNRSVGGCLYFLMLLHFQHFPLGDVIPSPHRSPMAFWTDKNVKRRVSVEKRSKKGLLLRVKPRQPLPQASVPPSTSFDPDTMLTHPAIDIRTAAIQLATRNLGASKIHCPKKPGMKEVKELERDVKEPCLELRRSQRVVIPSSVLKSPWIEPKRKSKGKRTYDEKDTLFEMCTKSVPRDEAAEEFVDMHHYFLTMEELQCLTPRSWINNKNNGFLRWTPWLSTELIIGCNMKRRIQRLRQPRKRRKQSLEKSKDLMANKMRNHFLAILRTLKPELLQDDHKIPKDVTWAKVHVQPDTHSCGVHVLTCLMGRSQEPHLIRLHHLACNGVYLRDVKRWIGEVRGKDFAETYAWSYKRRYKTGYVWQDLLDDDLITPISDNEYVLKGSQIQLPSFENFMFGERKASILNEELPVQVECCKVEPDKHVNTGKHKTNERNKTDTPETSFSISLSTSSSASLSPAKGNSKRFSTGASGLIRNLIPCRALDSNEDVSVVLDQDHKTVLSKNSIVLEDNNGQIRKHDRFGGSARSLRTSWNPQQNDGARKSCDDQKSTNKNKKKLGKFLNQISHKPFGGGSIFFR
ncbi:hypothetical protein K1719_023108 [Acacia pycnantha]|nr:hypothetical protein K1719_023108 [Acacia pycnantha]